MFPPQFPQFVFAQQPQPIFGVCFAAMVPAGAHWAPSPMTGGYVILPPGSTFPPASPAVIHLDPVHPMLVQGLMQSLWSMDHPFGATMQGMSVGLRDISHVAPARQIVIGQNHAQLREVEGISTASGQPIRGMLMLLHGPRGTVKALIMVNLYRWNEFVGPALQFVGSINLAGPAPFRAPEVQTVVDRDRMDQIEFRMRGGPEQTWEPITAMPTRVGGNVVVNIDKSFHVGSIVGSGNVLGEHSTSTVSQQG